MVTLSSFRASRWDPLLIILQIVAMQAIGYAFLGILFYILLVFSPYKRPVSVLFDIHLLKAQAVDSWTLLFLFVMSSICNGALLLFIVERARRCMDFAVTFYTINFIATWIHSGSFPAYPYWWFLAFVSGFIMTSLGRYLCANKELLPIALSNSSSRPPNLSSSNDHPSADRDTASFELDEIIEPKTLDYNDSTNKANAVKAPLLSSYSNSDKSLSNVNSSNNDNRTNAADGKKHMRDDSFSSFDTNSETSELGDYLDSIDTSNLEPELQLYLDDNLKLENQNLVVPTGSNANKNEHAKSSKLFGASTALNKQSTSVSENLLFEKASSDLDDEWGFEDEIAPVKDFGKKID